MTVRPLKVRRPSFGGFRVHNEFSGIADNVVQARNVFGDIVFKLPALRVQRRTPHELEATDPFFTDRADGLSWLSGPQAWGGGERVSITVVVGPPGIGKSAFTACAGARADGRFPDGELHVDLRALDGAAPGRAPLAEALARLLHGLGVDREMQPVAIADLVAMYRTWTADRTVLVVLDGVTEPAQVRSLRPTGPGSAVLATSARRSAELIRDLGARELVLPPLADGDSRVLLIRMCGPARIDADPVAAGELIRLCDGLPLALRVAGSRLAREPELTVRELLDELDDEGLGAVDALVATAYDALPDDARRAFRLLGAVPLPTFTPEVVAALLDVSRARARAAVRALSDLNLSVELPRRRFRLLGPIRRHAVARASQEAADMADAALDRLLTSFLTTALFADFHVIGRKRLRVVDSAPIVGDRADPFAGPAEAEQWLADNWSALLSTVELGARRGHPRLVWQLAEVVSALSLNTRRPADQVKVCRIGAEAAAVDQRFDARARLHIIASRGFLDLGDLDAARDALDAALVDAEQVGDRVLLASVWEFRGRYREVVGERQAAAAAYSRSLSLNEAAAEPRGAALAAFFLAGVADGPKLEVYEGLERTFREEFGDSRMAARVQVRLAEEHRRRGDLDRAAAVVGAAIGEFVARKAVHYEAQALLVLADIAEQAGDIGSAREALARAVEILEARADQGAVAARERLTALGVPAVKPRPAPE